MKLCDKVKYLTAVILIVSLICSPIFYLRVEATNGYENNTDSYNCYAYAINRILVNGKFYYYNSNSWTYQPGDISKNEWNVVFGPPYTLDKIKCNVIRDLRAMGHTDVVIYSNIDDANAYNSMIENIEFPTQELICFRVGPDDYHFMRYDSATSAWYNKIWYGPIFKYTNNTDNNGIPSNDVPWVGSKIYDSNIVYIAFNKLQINILESGAWEGSLTVKGGSEVNENDNNYIYCCNNEACCNPDGICECENTVNGGKDAVYEIVVHESGCYRFNLQIGGSLGFKGVIYSYNMYNGDYNIISNITDSQNFTKNIYLDVGENVVSKYYLRVHFDKQNICDMDISATVTREHTYNNRYESISSTQHKAYCECGDSIIEKHTLSGNWCIKCNEAHTHEYTDHYEQYSATQHKAYCLCGEYVLEDHFIAMNFCQLCDAPHTHDYSDHYIPKTNSTHISYCICGSTSIQPHVVSAGAFSSGNKYAICLACGGTATTGIILHQAIGNLPRSENGSFILPNGVIVLVDEDIEAYFDGRLEFGYPDDNLETE